MLALTRKRIIVLVAGALVFLALVYGFWPDPVTVEVAAVERDSMQVTVEEEGETQVADRYEISSPVSAFARRIEVEVGDSVEEGDPLVHLESPRASLLDPRSRAEARARAEAAEAQVQQAERRVEAAEAAAERAREERERTERLVEQGSATRQALEQAVSEERQAEANLQAARAAVASARAELASARAVLRAGPGLGEHQEVQSVLRAPASGRVLTVHRRSAGLVPPGDPLVEVGNTDLLEIHVDVLSQDALRIEPGMPVHLDQWGGGQQVEAVVDRVEPQGQTDVSALGVEEQRVTVVATLVSLPDPWTRIGSGYRVLARFIVWEEADVLQVPTSALFRTEDGWGVFVVEEGVASQRRVTVGRQSGLTAQIKSGLEEGETVIVHPGNELDDGVRVERREL